MSIAAKLREEGASVGSIIEIGYRADSIDRAIAESLDDELQAMNGYVLEVTAIGKEAILAYILVGDGDDRIDGTYGGNQWNRESSVEMLFRDCSMFACVGKRTVRGIEWYDPAKVNIYTRLKPK